MERRLNAVERQIHQLKDELRIVARDMVALIEEVKSNQLIEKEIKS